MKKIEWDNPNKMHFESLHKTFNHQCECISAGNVYGTVQFSSYVRSHSKTECNGLSNPEGHLRDFDLKQFTNLHWSVKSWFEKHSHNKKSVILYEFRHWDKRSGNRVKMIDGYVVTTDGHKLVEVWYCGNKKSRSAIDEAIKYITN